ncbi:Bifunctional protein FolD [Propionispora sp. 2/2-37]|uniref:bifunctional methylenetetrahydrofolate dehydrogenase/methenyltetrahydrofolate cyclohydrolase FolD n=1 Tax=Propionispora sp. 2/2-37 TaxID=1677858 RepID=UPI0006BB57AA|nr:bifunctional methylenetetrahydrofolate dehydrogenase/methenyltetrahydrofolate cyclohydrolase FolD [Propionispora sp. 2/2-37]CUH93970.1 Bifunctional protein FolD [Propionispora sp. 2/2-37]
MSARILDGKFYASKIKEETKAAIANLQHNYGVTPGLTVVIVGEDPASQIYVANKHKTGLEMGIGSEVIRLPEAVGKEELLAVIARLNQDVNVHGILVQLPLPQHIKQYETEIVNSIDPLKDVDGFHPVNAGKLAIGEEGLVPCTPNGCIRLLELADIPVEGKRAVVIGRSNIVGKPMFHLLLARHATVTVCHSRTQNLAEVTREADILVAAIGKPKFVTPEMVKPGAVILDVGINRVGERKIVGDVDFEAVQDVAGAITPVPGGVGVLTIAMLMHNTVRAAQLQQKKMIY